MLGEHDQCSELNGLAIARAILVIIYKCLLFSCYVSNNGSEVANLFTDGFMVPRSHTHRQVPAYMYQTIFFGFVTSCPKL